MLLQECIDNNQLSDAQLETVVYAFMRFDGPRLPTGARTQTHHAHCFIMLAQLWSCITD
jgi:hypothetical protein